jgi:hypothetical protein
VRKNAKDIFIEQPAMIFTAFCCNRFLKKKRYGFVRVPAKLNPRKLNMLARMTSDETISAEKLFKKENWFATLGDWDVF